jgi:hypothetical protein
METWIRQRLQPAVTQKVDSWTKSVVVKYPRKVLPPLPAGTELRGYWNDSENFNPVGQRRNIWNEELGSPSASTREYGAMLTLFRGKVDLRVNRFETRISSDSIAGIGNPYAYLNTMIVRMVSAHQTNLRPADFGYVHPTFNTFEDVARAFYATMPARLKQNIGPNSNFEPKFIGTGNSFGWEADTITNRASVSDTISTGLEIEGVWNPTRNWRIAVNVAKNEAVKSSVAREEVDFANTWIVNMQTMYNGSLLRGWRNPPTESATLLGQYRGEHVSGIETAAASSGTKAREIREWRANLVTRYEFSEGRLRGCSIGGSARWQDKRGIGYPFVVDATGKEVADLANPYFGPDELQVDLAFGFRRRLEIFVGKVDWNLGINIRNAIASDDLTPSSRMRMAVTAPCASRRIESGVSVIRSAPEASYQSLGRLDKLEKL